jgi:hypothetical protein
MYNYNSYEALVLDPVRNKGRRRNLTAQESFSFRCKQCHTLVQAIYVLLYWKLTPVRSIDRPCLVATRPEEEEEGWQARAAAAVGATTKQNLHTFTQMSARSVNPRRFVSIVLDHARIYVINDR